MPAKTRPYEQFGSYILFKNLESDALGDLWRAARIDDRHLGPLVALRRLAGGNRPALVQSAMEARQIAPLLDGTSFVKQQVIEIVNGTPFIAHEYGGGRSLSHVLNRARGGVGVTPNPIPIDHAVLIAEKVALSLATTAELRYGSTRLVHGALIPQFIWISEDGETRVAGQQLGKGLIASLKEGKVAAAIGRYFSPEYQHSAEPTKASEVYAMGAILYLLVTGHEPPEAASVSAFAQTIRAAKTMAGHPIPDDIRAVLDKSLVIDPARRFESIADMKQALSALAHGGKYSATTFNLAFYLSNLLKKEMEGEAIDREKESKVNIAPYLERNVVAPPPSAAVAGEGAGPTRFEPIRSNSRLFAAAALIVVAAGVGGFFMIRASMPGANARIASAKPASAPPPAKPNVIAQPVITATIPAAAPAATATVDPAAQKKAFEQAVNQKLQGEMAKLQAQFNKEMRPQSKPAPVQTAGVGQAIVPAAQAGSPAPHPQMDDRPPSAAAFDERRLAARQESPIQTAAPVTQTQAPQPQPQVQPQIAVPAPVQAPVIHEGDVINFDEVDVRPQPITMPRVIYPPLAMRQRAQASLILTVFVSEKGDVLDVKVLRGDSRFGFNEEAARALRATKFRPALKDGKRVKTWIPQPIEFKLQ